MESQEANNCPCKRLKCERHGNCIACKEHHYNHKTILPTCERIKEKAEKRAKQREARNKEKSEAKKQEKEVMNE